MKENTIWHGGDADSKHSIFECKKSIGRSKDGRKKYRRRYFCAQVIGNMKEVRRIQCAKIEEIFALKSQFERVQKVKEIFPMLSIVGSSRVKFDPRPHPSTYVADAITLMAVESMPSIAGEYI